MNHTAQEPKSLQLAAELDYRREYEAAHELRTMQALIAKLEAQLYAISTVEVGQSIQPPVQADTAAPAQLPAAHQEPVAWKWRYKDGELSVASFDTRAQCERNSEGVAGEAVPLYTAPQPPVQADTEAPLRCDVCGVECANPWHFSTETKRHKHACDACWGRMKIPGQVGELDHTTAAQQEPVAWIEHEWSGTGLRHLHFEKREPMVRDEVVNPVWTPLYTAPPQRQPLTDEQIWADDGIMMVNAGLGLLMKDIALLVRAIEQAHGITAGQQ